MSPLPFPLALFRPASLSSSPRTFFFLAARPLGSLLFLWGTGATAVFRRHRSADRLSRQLKDTVIQAGFHNGLPLHGTCHLPVFHPRRRRRENQPTWGSFSAPQIVYIYAFIWTGRSTAVHPAASTARKHSRWSEGGRRRAWSPEGAWLSRIRMCPGKTSTRLAAGERERG